MKSYFYLQLKRVVRFLPFVLTVTAVLLSGLVLILYGALTMFANREDNLRFQVGVAGDTDSEYIRWSIAAMQTFDETRFSIDFVEMTEEQAENALRNGTISAYVVMPENFVEEAMSGNVEPITYVTTTGAEGLTDLFKKEITTLVTDMVVRSQQGAYGLGDVLRDNGLGNVAGEHMTVISLRFAELIFERGEMYAARELGVSDGLSTPEYYVCAVTIMLFMLIGLPFAVLYVKRDYAFHRLLLSRGYSCGRQVLCEYGVQAMAMVIQTVVIVVAVVVTVRVVPTFAAADMAAALGDFTVRLIPVVLMISAFNLMMFELSGNMVSGLLLHFFTAVGLCYVSGCLYPVYTLPPVLQTIAGFLPTGIARQYLSTCFTWESSVGDLTGLILYTAVFYGLAWLIRSYKIKGIRRGLCAKTA